MWTIAQASEQAQSYPIEAIIMFVPTIQSVAGYPRCRVEGGLRQATWDIGRCPISKTDRSSKRPSAFWTLRLRIRASLLSDDRHVPTLWKRLHQSGALHQDRAVTLH